MTEVKEAELSLIGHSIKVLDDGFVRLVDSMGTDSSVVQAARVSYGAGTKTIREDAGLINYLMQNSHTTPFEMCELKFHVRIPMDAWRQMVRHRTANINEYSTRYSEAINAMQKTDADSWRLQSVNNKQGSFGMLPLDLGQEFTEQEARFHQDARAIYEERLAAGMAKEQARKDLPLSNYTEAYWKCDLHNILHYLRLRMDSHAQLEIREYANAIGWFVERLFPLTWAAFQEHVVNAKKFSASEWKTISEFVGWAQVAKRTAEDPKAKRLHAFAINEIEATMLAGPNYLGTEGM